MKRSKKVVALALGCVATATLGCFAVNAVPAKAEVNNDKFEMYYGAQVALTKDGMRWVIEMGQNTYDKIVTNDTENNVYLTAFISSKTQFDKITDGAYNNLATKVEIQFEDEDIYYNGEYYYANAALTELEAVAQFDKNLVAIGAIATKNGETVSYEFANFNGGDIDNNVRTQYQILQAAALDSSADADYASEVILGGCQYYDWFGSEDYPLVVDNADKYAGFVAQINKGFEINVNADVYTEYANGESVTFPATVTKYHKVSFYESSDMKKAPLKEVVVKDGESVEAPTNTPKYMNLEAVGSTYVKGYKTDGTWVEKINGTETVVDNFDAITKTQVVWLKWVHGQQQVSLQEDLAINEPNTIFSYDTELGVCHVGSDPDSPNVKSFDTTVKLDGQRGSTKLYFANDSGSSQLWIPYKGSDTAYYVWNYDFTGHENDYLMMDVYVDFVDTVEAVWIRTGRSTYGTSIPNKTWGRMIVPISAITSQISSGGHWWWCVLRGTAGAGSIYLTKGTLLSADKVIDLSTNTGDYKVGNTTLTGAATNFSYNGISTKGTHKRTPDDGVFNQTFNYETFLMNGELFYYHDAGVDGAIRMEFAEEITGKFYVTARGFSDNVCMQIFNSAGTHLGTPRANKSGVEVVDAGDGYKTYCFDFGTNKVKAIRLFTGYATTDTGYAYYRQIVIRDMTVA